LSDDLHTFTPKATASYVQAESSRRAIKKLTSLSNFGKPNDYLLNDQSAVALRQKTSGLAKATSFLESEKNMKYICLGYIEPNKFETMSEGERNAMLDECFIYDEVLRKNGHFAAGEALQSANTATTLRWQNGKVTYTDGPYAETKEQLGGILVLEARDLNHAIELMSKHPGVKTGPFEIRPAADLTEMMRESEQRRAKNKGHSSGNPIHAEDR
jgi:hypothetical protein